MSIVEDALALAYMAHKNQDDKCGQPFLGHPLRVAARIAAQSSSEVIAAALVHDVVEDTAHREEGRITLEDVERVLGPYVARLVDALTRRADERYVTYIKRVSLDAEATVIKLADIEDNTDPRRRHTGYESMQRRYMQALAILREER